VTENHGPRVPLVPDNAPFDEEQRAWLNGFLAGVLGLTASEPKPGAPPAAAGARREEPAAGLESGETVGKQALELRLLSALARLDCGQCGYSCLGYAQALASRSEQDTTLCVPGGPGTRETLDALLAETAPAGSPAAGLARAGRPVRALAEAPLSLRNPQREAGSPDGAAAGAASERWHAQRLRVKSQRRLTLADAGSEIREVVLDLSESSLSYRAGDSLAIFPHNDPDLVRALLRALGARGQELVTTAQGVCEVWRCLLENVDITDVSPTASQDLKSQEGTSLNSVVEFSLVRDSRDNIFEPSSGSRNSLEFMFAGLGGDTQFYKVIAESAWFVPLPVFNLVWAVRGLFGMAEGWGGQEVPIFERFFLGGATTLRGQRTRSVAPKDAQGEIIGGDKELLFNTELLIPIVARFRLALFFDAGNAYGFGTDFDPTNLRYGAGVGVRFFSPLGPMRLDLGYNLDKQPGEKQFQVNFTVGAPF